MRYLVYFLTLFGAGVAEEGGIRTMPVSRTPEANTVVLRLAFPKEGALVGSSIWVQFRVDGFALGSPSPFERANEVAVSNMGQTVHVVIDNHPYFAINGPAIDPFDQSGNYYDTSYKFEIPFRLSQGQHTIRLFPTRSFGESLKGDNTFVASQFYVGSQKGDQEIDLSAPYLTYNEPNSHMSLQAGQPILLDFYVSNAELSADGYKVRLSIDGKSNRVLTSWQPYYIYGLKAGKHTVRLELLDEKNQQVSGPFNDVSQTIIVH